MVLEYNKIILESSESIFNIQYLNFVCMHGLPLRWMNEIFATLITVKSELNSFGFSMNDNDLIWLILLHSKIFKTKIQKWLVFNNVCTSPYFGYRPRGISLSTYCRVRLREVQRIYLFSLPLPCWCQQTADVNFQLSLSLELLKSTRQR